MTVPHRPPAQRSTVQIPASARCAIEARGHLPPGRGPPPPQRVARRSRGTKAGGGCPAGMMAKPKNGARLFGRALLGRVGSLFGREPIYIPGHGRPGDLSIGATPDGPFGEKLMTPEDGTPWHDRVAARSLLSFAWRGPVRPAASTRFAFLLVVPAAARVTRV